MPNYSFGSFSKWTALLKYVELLWDESLEFIHCQMVSINVQLWLNLSYNCNFSSQSFAQDQSVGRNLMRIQTNNTCCFQGTSYNCFSNITGDLWNTVTVIFFVKYKTGERSIPWNTDIIYQGMRAQSTLHM